MGALIMLRRIICLAVFCFAASLAHAGGPASVPEQLYFESGIFRLPQTFSGGHLDPPGSGYTTMRTLARLGERYGRDNARVNPPMSIPAYDANAPYYLSGDIVTNGGTTYVQMQGPYCIPGGTPPTGTTSGATYVYDGASSPSGTQCAWKSTTEAASGGAPTITGATVWAISQTYPAGGHTITFSGSGSAQVGAVYHTASSCTTASSGTGPSGASPATDGTCTWVRDYASIPIGANQHVWNSGSGDILSYLNLYGGPAGSSGGGYLVACGHGATTGAVTACNSALSMEIVTDADIFDIFGYETKSISPPTPNGWRLVVCNPDGSGCQLARTTPTTVPLAGYFHLIVDFSGQPRKLRSLWMQAVGAPSIGGLAISPNDTATKPIRPSLYVGVFGDSYPAGGGVKSIFSGFPAVFMDHYGLRYFENQAVGGCGYDAATGTCGSAISRLPGVRAINGGAGPDLELIANGTNDITTGLTPAQIAAEATAFVQGLHTVGTSTAHSAILMLGIYAHNNGGTSCTSCVNTESAIQTSIGALSDSLLTFCSWTTALSPWETGTGGVHAVAGNGNADYFYDGSVSPYNAAHPNALGNLQFGRRTADCLRNALLGPLY